MVFGFTIYIDDGSDSCFNCKKRPLDPSQYCFYSIPFKNICDHHERRRGLMDRYVIKYGRFGAYFFDKEQNRDVDLNEALLIMNNRIHDWIKFGEALGGEYKR